MVKRGLGKGLEALIPDTANTQEVKEINIYDIDPSTDQPRKTFDQHSIDELAQSVKKHGIIQPIILKKVKNRYTIIAGERRWRAAKAAGLKKIPAIIKQMDDQDRLEVSLIENLQRQDLNIIEQAEAINTLISKYNMTQQDIAQTLGKSRSSVANILRLLTLDSDIKLLLQQNKISYGHARALLAIEDKNLQKRIAKKIIEQDLTVRDVENIAKNLNEKSNNKYKKVKKYVNKDVHIIEIEEEFASLFGTKVNIVKGKKKGKIEIEFYNEDDFERIYEIINRVQ